MTSVEEAIGLVSGYTVYLGHDPDYVYVAVRKSFALTDRICIPKDAGIRRCLEFGQGEKGMGRGHVKSVKEVRAKRSAQKPKQHLG